MAMRTLFRVDSSSIIGAGHVMRCLTLARRIRDAKGTCVFVCRKHEGNLSEFIRSDGFEVRILPEVSPKTEVLVEDHSTWFGTLRELDAEQTLGVCREMGGVDWLIADHYAVDWRWTEALREGTKKVLIIDDLVDRLHDCDALLDQTYGATVHDYEKLVKGQFIPMMGTEYTLLREEFKMLRSQSLKKRELKSSVERVLIAMGGMDLRDLTCDIIHALKNKRETKGLTLDVVISSCSPYLTRIRDTAEKYQGVCLHVDTDKMAELMFECDVAVGAGGTTTWERCALGLPAVCISTAQNQERLLKSVSEQEAIIYAGCWQSSGPTEIVEHLQPLIENQEIRYSVSSRAAILCDGNGASRVTEQMMTALSSPVQSAKKLPPPLETIS